MRSAGKLTYATMLQAVLLLVAIQAQAQTPGSPRNIRIEEVLGARIVGAHILEPLVQISPDGQLVVYQVNTPQLKENSFAVDLWLVPRSGQAQPRQLTKLEPSRTAGRLMPRWSPDSRTIAYTPRESGIALVSAADGTTTTLVDSIETARTVLPFSVRSVRDYQWSPDGREMAFLATIDRRPAPSPLRGQEDVVSTTQTLRTALFTINLATKRIDVVTDSTTHVHSYGWSPDAQRFVISAGFDESEPRMSHMQTDLFIVDRRTGIVRPLVQLAGRDTEPIWSPDGKWIAFGSQWGKEDWYQQTQPTVVRASGGEPRRAGAELMQRFGPTVHTMFWSPDGKTLYTSYLHEMHQSLFAIPVDGGPTRQVTPNDSTWYADFSISAATGEIAYTRQRVTHPADVYVSDPTRFAPKRLTDINPEFRDIVPAGIEEFTWRSADNKWDIAGLLITPPDYRQGQRYPLLVFINGGPGMVLRDYSLHGQYCLLCYAADGFAVFVPNTRGRGGFGEAFLHAIDTGRAPGSASLHDIYPGIDELVRRGVADPDRMGVMGFSFGGFLTMYTVTQTNRFRAAVDGDGPIDWVSRSFDASRSARNIMRTLDGMGSAHDPAEHARLIKESPIFHVSRIQTPLLLEYGGVSSLRPDGVTMITALREFGVPSELVVYPRTGHGISELALRLDSYQRQSAWFNYWVLDRPYNDAKKQQVYDKWRTLRVQAGDPRWRQ